MRGQISQTAKHYVSSGWNGAGGSGYPGCFGDGKAYDTIVKNRAESKRAVVQSPDHRVKGLT